MAVSGAVKLCSVERLRIPIRSPWNSSTNICVSPQEFAAAAHSLIVLGVPAKSVFIRAAKEVAGGDKDLFCSALGLIGGAEPIGILCDVAADEHMPDQQRSYAAMALRGHLDSRIGPVMTKALASLMGNEAIARFAHTLAGQRYETGAPALLEAFTRVDNVYYRIDIAHTLSTLC